MINHKQKKLLHIIAIYFLALIGVTAYAKEDSIAVANRLKNFQSTINKIDLTDSKMIEFSNQGYKKEKEFALKLLNINCKERNVKCLTAEDLSIASYDLNDDGIKEIFVEDNSSCSGKGCFVHIISQNIKPKLIGLLIKQDNAFILKDTYDKYHSIVIPGKEWDCADSPFDGISLYRWNKSLNSYIELSIIQAKGEKPACDSGYSR